jgi:hypothetical protein
MARESRSERRRAGSSQRDSKHRAGGDWTTLSIPEGIEIFQPKEGTVRFDIVPFEAGKGNPYAKPGEWYYERTFYTHGRVGPNNESYVCLAKTAGKPCPICEYRAKLAFDPDEGNEKLIKSLKPKERQLFLIHVVKRDDDGGNKVMLYESSFHTFGKLLDKKRQDAEEDEPHISNFDDEKAGSTLKVSYSEEDAGGYTFLEAYSIEFKPRPNGLDSELLDHGICLDDVVKLLPYDELKRLFLQDGGKDKDDDDDDEPAPRKAKPKAKNDDDWEDEPAPKKKTAPKDEDEDEPEPKKNKSSSDDLEEGQQVRHRQFGVCEIVRINDDGSLLLKNDEGKRFKGVTPKNVRPLVDKPKAKPKAKDEDEEEAPPKKTPPKKTQTKDEDDDGWGDEDEEDRPTPSQKKNAQTAKASPAAAKKKSRSDEDDDGWGDEDEPAPKNRTTAPEDDDDWD